MLFKAYQCLLEHEESTWRKKERYERLHPRERLAKHLGVHKSHLSNYFYGCTAIPESLNPYFAIEEICAVLIDLAQLLPQYHRAHEFEFFWNLPHLEGQVADGIPSCGEARVRYEFDLGKAKPTCGGGEGCLWGE